MQKATIGQKYINTDSWNSMVDALSPRMDDATLQNNMGSKTVAEKRVEESSFACSKFGSNLLKIKIGNIVYNGLSVPLVEDDVNGWFPLASTYGISDKFKILDIKPVKYTTDDTFTGSELNNTEEITATDLREVFVVVKLYYEQVDPAPDEPISAWDSEYPFPALDNNTPNYATIFITNSYELAGLGQTDPITAPILDIYNTSKCIAKLYIYNNGDIAKVEPLYYNDITFSTITGLSDTMPFDCGFGSISAAPVPPETEPTTEPKIKVRNGGFYFKRGENTYSFIGQGEDALTVTAINDYVFEEFTLLDYPTEPTSESDPTKFIVWAGIDTESTDDEVFEEITPADEVPDRETSILIPIAELNWTLNEETSEYVLSLNQLKRGFIYDEPISAPLPFDIKLDYTNNEILIYLPNSQSELVNYQGAPLTIKAGSVTGGVNDWYTLTSLAECKIYVYAEPLNSYVDPAISANLEYTFITSSSSFNRYQNSTYLAEVVADGLLYKIKQYKHGVINWFCTIPDSDVPALGFSTYGEQGYSMQSLNAPQYGQMELFEFHNPTILDSISVSDAYVLVRKSQSGSNYLRYTTLESLFENIDFPEPPDLDAWFDGFYWDWLCTQLANPPIGENPWQCLVDYMGANILHNTLPDLQGGVDGSFYHLGADQSAWVVGGETDGVTIDGWTVDGVVTGTGVIEIDANQLRDTDKILVRRTI